MQVKIGRLTCYILAALIAQSLLIVRQCLLGKTCRVSSAPLGPRVCIPITLMTSYASLAACWCLVWARAEDPVASYCELCDQNAGKDDENGEDDDEENQDRRRKPIEPLPRVNHDEIEYADVDFTFYAPHPESLAMKDRKDHDIFFTERFTFHTGWHTMLRHAQIVILYGFGFKHLPTPMVRPSLCQQIPLRIELLTEEEVAKLRQELRVTATGSNCPRPVVSFAHLRLPKEQGSDFPLFQINRRKDYWSFV